MKDFLKQYWHILIVSAVRYFVGASLIFPSIIKIRGHRFFGYDGTNYPIDSFGHFFEVMYRSQPYWQFIGWSQFMAGAFLLTGVFSSLGALMSTTIFLNIFFITLSYYFAFTPAIVFIYVILSFLLLWFDKDKMYYLLWDKLPKQPNPYHVISMSPQIRVAGGIILLMSIAFCGNPLYCFPLCTLVYLSGVLILYFQTKVI